MVPLIALAGTAGGGLAGLKRWRKNGAPKEWSADAPAGGEDAGPAEIERRRLLAGMSVALSALFTILVVVQWLPTILFHPCQQ